MGAPDGRLGVHPLTARLFERTVDHGERPPVGAQSCVKRVVQRRPVWPGRDRDESYPHELALAAPSMAVMTWTTRIVW
jgi:hypothetical protein